MDVSLKLGLQKRKVQLKKKKCISDDMQLLMNIVWPLQLRARLAMENVFHDCEFQADLVPHQFYVYCPVVVRLNLKPAKDNLLPFTKFSESLETAVILEYLF